MAHFIERLLALVYDPSCHEVVLSKGMLPGIANEIMNEEAEDRHRQCALEAVRQLASHPKCLEKIQEQSPALVEYLYVLAENNDAESYLAESILEKLGVTEGSKADGASSATSPPSVAKPAAGASAASGAGSSSRSGDSARRAPRTITIDLTGQMGDRELNDAYTHALLLVSGVTSVTMDPKNRRVVVFSHSEGELRPALMEAINRVREVHAEQLGEGAREPLAALDQAVYLDDEDEEEVFGEGAVAEKMRTETVEARLARRRAEKVGKEAPPQQEGIVDSVLSWIGW